MPKHDAPITDIPAEFTTTATRIQYMLASAHEALARAAYDPENVEDKVDPKWAAYGPIMAFFHEGVARHEQRVINQKLKPPTPEP